MTEIAKSEGEKKAPARRALDPFASFRSEMDRLFDSYFDTGAFPSMPRMFGAEGVAGERAMVMPKVDISDGEKAITISAELPGVDEKDVEVTLRDGVLTLKGEKKYEKKEEKDEVQIMERRYGSFQRSFRLPEGIDQGKIDAKFDKGILTVTAAKLPEAQKEARKISISKE